MTQCEELLQMMDENGFVTSMDAYERGITRISARIYDLKQMGYNIVTELVCGKNRHGKPMHYFKYRRAV